MMFLMLMLFGFVLLGATLQLTKSYRLGGETYSESTSLDATAAITAKKSLAAAKVGVLTVRTDNDTGSLTMDAGHGFITGDRLDVYWNINGVKGCRRGMVAGIVAGLVVPIDLGAGDVLPAAAAAITAMVPAQVDIGISGDDILAVCYAAAAHGCIVVASAADAELDAKVFNIAGSDSWYTGLADVNPLAGDTVAKVFLSHGDSTATRIVKAGFAI